MNDLTAFLNFLAGLVQTVAAPVIVYLVWEIKRNHLPHIYDRLGNVERGVARLTGIDEAEARRGK